MGKFVSFYQVVESRGDFNFAYCPGFGTVEEARKNIETRTGTGWSINKVTGHYTGRGTWKRDAEMHLENVK